MEVGKFARLLLVPLFLLHSITLSWATLLQPCPDVGQFKGIPGIENSHFKLCHGSDAYAKTVAPIPSTGPLKINSSLEIIDLGKLDENLFFYSMSVHLHLTWTDSRLKILAQNNSLASNEVTLILDQEQESLLWVPNVYIYELKNFYIKRSLSTYEIHVLSATGQPQDLDSMSKNTKTTRDVSLTMADRFEVDITCGFNHSNFPFDVQQCLFRIGVQDYDIDKVLFEPLVVMDWTQVHEPKYMEQSAKLAFDKTVTSLGRQAFDLGKFYSYTGLSIVLRRQHDKYMWGYFFPLFLFVIMSWLSFVIHHEQVPGRMGLLVTLFLILINTYASTVSTAPPIKGSGIIGQWMLGCQTMIFMAMLEYGLILYMVKFKGHLWLNRISTAIRPKEVKFMGPKTCLDVHSMCKKLDGWCLIVMPLIFLLFNIWFWIRITYL